MRRDRQSDAPGLKDLLLTAEEMVRAAWHGTAQSASNEDGSLGSEAAGALNRLTQIGAVMLDEQAYALVPTVIDSLVHLFRDADDAALAASPRELPEASVRRRDLIVRVFTLGALAVQQRAYHVVPCMVLQTPQGIRNARYWIRETVTSLAREERFEPKSFVPVAAEYIAGQPTLFRRFRNNQDDVVSALCRFDFLHCAVVVAESGELREAYPSFGAYFNERTEPIVEALVSGAARDVVPVDDAKLASIIVGLDDRAAHAFFHYVGWQRNDWQTTTVREFLRVHATGAR